MEYGVIPVGLAGVDELVSGVVLGESGCGPVCARVGSQREAGCAMKWRARLCAIGLAVFGGLFVYLGNLVDGPAVLLFALMFIVCLISSLFLFLLSKAFK